MSLNEAFHFLFGGAAAKQILFEVGNGSIVFDDNEAEHTHIHGFVLSNPTGDACVVTFTDADGAAFYSCAVAANGSVVYNGAPFYIDNGITITVTSSGTANIRWSVAHCGELVQR